MKLFGGSAQSRADEKSDVEPASALTPQFSVSWLRNYLFGVYKRQWEKRGAISYSFRFKPRTNGFNDFVLALERQPMAGR
jgi:hypothetical protein